MPFCTKCGNQVKEADKFCERCGARQGAFPAGAGPADPLSTITPRTAKVLCYIPMVGWLAAIVVLASERFRRDRDVRFHAFQGIYLFVAWLIVERVINPLFEMLPGPPFPGGHLLSALVLVVWVFMLIKTSQEQSFRLPILGELAERSVSEQR